MATVLEVVKDALEELGVYGAGETPNADDAALCLRALNNIVDAWCLENLTIYATQDVSAALPSGTTSLTIGLTEDFNTARPVRLEDGCFVRVGDIDYPLEVISKARYNDIALKGTDGPWPRYVMYDATHPTGTVYFWPRGACTVHLNVQVSIAQFTATTNTLDLPPGYKRALGLMLAAEIAPKFDKQLKPPTAGKLIQAVRMLKRANLVVPQLDMGCRDTLPGCYAILAG